MAALTAATNRSIVQIWSHKQHFKVANSVKIYAGSFTALPGTGGNTADRGYLLLYQNVATIEYCGLAIAGSPTGDVSTSNTVTGDTTVAAGLMPRMEVEMGPMHVKRVAVTSVSAVSDIGKQVYLSNDNDMTITAALSPAVGRIIDWYSSTTADVALYGYLLAIVI